MDDGPDRVTTALRQIALGRLFRRAKVLGHVDEQMLSVYRDLGVVVKNEVVNPNKTAEDRSIYQLVEPGWLVVNRMKAWQGSIGIADIRGIVSGHYICFRPTHRENNRFLHYLLRSPDYTAQFAAISRGVRPGQIEIDNDELAATKVRLPPFDEQRRIADFLDDQVARINNIIAARSAQSLALRAIIDRKNDEEWEALAKQYGAARVTHLISGMEQGWSPEADAREAAPLEWAVMRAGCVNRGIFAAEDHKALPPELEPRRQYEIKPGDLLMSRANGSRDLIGSVAVVGPGTRGRLLLPDKIYRIAVDPSKATVGYLAMMLRSRAAREQITSGISGADGMANNLPAPVVKSVLVPAVPVELQSKIAAAYELRLQELAAQTDRLIRSNDLLAELKRSLVTAAVTGGFDVSSADGSLVPIA